MTLPRTILSAIDSYKQHVEEDYSDGLGGSSSKATQDSLAALEKSIQDALSSVAADWHAAFCFPDEPREDAVRRIEFDRAELERLQKFVIGALGNKETEVLEKLSTAADLDKEINAALADIVSIDGDEFLVRHRHIDALVRMIHRNAGNK